MGRKNQVKEGWIRVGSDISSLVRIDKGWVDKNQVEEGRIRVGSDISSLGGMDQFGSDIKS